MKTVTPLSPPGQPKEADASPGYDFDGESMYNPSKDKQIEEFRGSHYFLSNASPYPVDYEKVRYPTIDHAFVAASTLNETDRQNIAEMESPTQARRAARDVQVRSDWEDVKHGIMLELIRTKFTSEKEKDRLLATGNATLINRNTRGDTTWGVDLKTGVGENELGTLLMRVRDELRGGVEQEQPSTSHVEKDVASPDTAQQDVAPEQETLVIEFDAKRKPETRNIAHMRHHVHENGDISYSFSDLHSRVFGRTAFTDRGSRVTIESEEPRAVRAAMHYAKESWGSQPVILRISSVPEDLMLREAVSAGLNVQNPELQPQIERLREEQAKTRSGRNNARTPSSQLGRENAVERA